MSKTYNLKLIMRKPPEKNSNYGFFKITDRYSSKVSVTKDKERLGMVRLEEMKETQ